jgi:hypothetical protein
MKSKQKTLSLHRVEAVNISHAGKSEEIASESLPLEQDSDDKSSSVNEDLESHVMHLEDDDDS